MLFKSRRHGCPRFAPERGARRAVMADIHLSAEHRGEEPRPVVQCSIHDAPLPARYSASPEPTEKTMAFKRYADAAWSGDLQTGKGSMSTPQSGLFDAQNYSFKTRFGDEKGTNPEELLAAAHAGCFSMALSLVLGQAGFVAESISTRVLTPSRMIRRIRRS